MRNVFTSKGIAARVWILSNLVFGVGWAIGIVITEGLSAIWSCMLATVGAAIGSLPSLVILLLVIPWIEGLSISRKLKITNLIVSCFIITLLYGITGGLIYNFWMFPEDWWSEIIVSILIITGALFGCSLIALFLSRKRLLYYFTSYKNCYLITQSNKMETTQHPSTPWDKQSTASSNKTLIKSIITGALILIMMIPTVFITNLVREREARHREIAGEVSSKWAAAQTLTGPYLFIPYKTYYKDKDGKVVQEKTNHLWILPDNLNVTGTIDHETRRRSIYKVLLYRAGLQNSGNFILQIPKDINAADIQWADVKICYGISDFKGIEERFTIKFNGKEYELSPGLPANDIDDKGLSASVSITPEDMEKSIVFDGRVKIKGSEQLHFVPLAGNSSFDLASKWPNPSFDGNNLPTERQVSDKGFHATWKFNKANLPFGTILKDFKFDQEDIAFGVAMLEPADQYAKTSRCVKYAILFIGLTFSLFFIVELMQKKPVHPVQYVLIGMALVIFYTLLLSISEFVLFDYAYLVAATGTILLITLYARGHFNNWKSARIFGGVLSVLYGFIFILIRLEDTALLVGSIGLFIVLSLVMYASRKINWYGSPVRASES